MKKLMNSLLVMGLVVCNATTAFAAIPQDVSALEQSVSTSVTLEADKAAVDYSKFLENGGGELWVKLTLNGAQFNTSDPYVIQDAITQNYDIQTSLAVCNDGKSIEFGVYAPNAGIEYMSNWEITIDSSVLTSDSDVTVSIPVRKDMATINTPKIITDKQSITAKELEEGFWIVLEGINGAYFNTSCTGGLIRQSMIRTSNISISPTPYCEGVESTRVEMFIRALNGVPADSKKLEFRIEGDATNSTVPLIVSLPITR